MEARQSCRFNGDIPMRPEKSDIVRSADGEAA